MRELLRRITVSVLLALFIIAISTPIGNSLTGWSPTTNYPSMVQGESCVADSGIVYCVGGSPSPGMVTGSVNFGPLSSAGVSSWSPTMNYQFGVSGTSCVVFSGSIYCIGGNIGGSTDTNNVFFATLSSAGVGPWTPAANNYPIPVDSQSCVVDSGFVYCVGGNSMGGPAVAAVYFAQLSSTGVGPWIQGTNYQTNILGQSCVDNSGFIDCIAGTDGATLFNTIYSAQLSPGGGPMGPWMLVPSNYPINTDAQSCVVGSGSVYCIGGSMGGPGTGTNAVYFASLSAMGMLGAWNPDVNYPNSISGQSCVVSSGVVYCIAGLAGGTVTASVNFAAFLPQDFSLTVSPSTITTIPVNPQQANAVVSPVNGFTGTVALTVSSSSASWNCNASPNSLTLSISGASQASGVTCSGTTGTYTVTVTATSGSLTHTASVRYTVVDFSVVATSPLAQPGGSATSTITVTPINGYSGQVALAGNQPSGPCGTITPNLLNFPNPPIALTATLTCTSSNPSPNTIPVTISGNGIGGGSCGGCGSLSHSTTVTFGYGAGFSIDASQTVNPFPGGSTVTMRALNGFSGSVTLGYSSSPNGLGCSLPGSIPLTTGSPQSFTLSCNSGAPGTYTVRVNGNGSCSMCGPNLSNSTSVEFTSTQDFGIAASPSGIRTGPSGPQPTTITMSPVNGFSSSVNLFASTGSPNWTCNLNPPTINPGQQSALACNGTAGTYTVTVTGTSTSSSSSLTHTAAVTYTVIDFSISVTSPSGTVSNTPNVSTTITVTALNGFTGQVMLTDGVPSGLSCGTISPSNTLTFGSSPQTATVTCNSTVASTYGVAINAAPINCQCQGVPGHSTTATFQITDFTLAASSPVPVVIGTQTSSTITVTGVNSFTGTVGFALPSSSTPPGLTCNTPTSVLFGPSPQTSGLPCSAATAGNYVETVTGSSGTDSHTTSSITFQVVDFTIAAGAVSSTMILAGSPATSTITVTPVNGLTGMVTLIPSASTPAGLVCSLPTSVMFGSSAQTADLSCYANTAADYTVTVTGQDGTAVHTTLTITFHIVDFSISTTPTVPMNVGTYSSPTISIGALNGFTGTVNFATTPSSGLMCTSPASVTLGTSPQTSSLTCTAESAGVYTLAITASTGPLTRSTTIIFQFLPFPAGNGGRAPMHT